jgi:hypothetical protein
MGTAKPPVDVLEAGERKWPATSTPRLFISEASSAIREIRAGRWACGGCGLPRPHTSVPKEESPVKNGH